MKHHVINIKDRKYIYFPYSQMFFQYSDIMKNMLDGKQTPNEYVMSLISEEDKKREMITRILQHDLEVEHYISGAEINVLHGCNMQCRYCFAGEGNHGKTGKISIETIRDILNFMGSKASKPNIKLQIVGGEPLLDFDIFKELINEGKQFEELFEKPVYFSVISNGINIDQKVSDFIKDNHIELIISLDSGEKSINDFLRPTKSGISAYQYIIDNFSFYEGNTGVNVNVTITPYNLKISEIATFLFETQNVNYVHFSEVISDLDDMQFSEKNIDELILEYEKLTDFLIQKYKKHEYVGCYPLTASLDKISDHIPIIRPCGVLKSKCAFSPSGQIYPCDVMMFDDYCIGDVKNGFDNNAIEKLRGIYKEESHCNECWARYLCGGECLSTQQWNNSEQRSLRCRLKRHICKLKLYLYETIVNEIGDVKQIIGGN